jgi:osmotically-inducible protein OsmY
MAAHFYSKQKDFQMNMQTQVFSDCRAQRRTGPALANRTLALLLLLSAVAGCQDPAPVMQTAEAAPVAEQPARTPAIPVQQLPTGLSDAELSAKVQTVLQQNMTLSPFHIQVQSQLGNVTLSGVLENQQQIELALSLTRETDEVASVQNALTLRQNEQ